MFEICYHQNNKDGSILQYKKKLHEAVKFCKQLALNYKKENPNAKLLDYERTYKSERLAYGIYFIVENKLVNELRVYEK